MRQKSHSTDLTSEIVKGIRRATWKRYSAEEKIRIVLDGLRGAAITEAPIRSLNERAAALMDSLVTWITTAVRAREDERRAGAA